MRHLGLGHDLPRLSPPRGLLPALAGIAVCVLWVAVHVHFGLAHQIVPSRRDPDWPSDVALLGILFAAGALGLPSARLALAQATRGTKLRHGLAPQRRAQPLTREDLLAAASFGAYAANSSASSMASASGRSWIAHRQAGPILIALGGPTGEVHEAPELQRRFLVRARRSPVIWYGAGSATARSGLGIGQEAIVRLAGYGLDNPGMANLRHSIARARRARVGTLRGPWHSLPEPVRAQLPDLVREWRRRHPLPLRLTLSRLEDAAADDRLWIVAVAGGRVEGCVTWLPAGDGRGLVLDLMRRRQDAVPGVMEYLIHEGLLGGRERGLEWASLGVCCDDAAAGRPRWPLTAFNPPSLRRFKQKFGPEWHDRYLVAPGLPRPVALLAVAWAHVRSPIGVHTQARSRMALH